MIEHLEKEISNILNRIPSVKGKGEEATKQALVLPWLNALGYDIWDPSEVCPEFESDTAIKKAGQKEKVDLAILFDNSPVVFIEVKPLGEPLSGHHGQLKRYFNSTTSVALAILTNGVEYRFFTDTAESNIMDDEPFFVSKLDSSEQGLEVIARFGKKAFSIEAIRDFATELKFTAVIEKFLTNELDIRDRLPSESFVRWVLNSGIYENRITANVVERFYPITKEALQRVQMRLVRRSIAKMEEGVSSAEKMIDLCEPEVLEDISKEVIEQTKIVTTEEELEIYDFIKVLAEKANITNQCIFDPGKRKDTSVEVLYRDTTGYFSVFINKTSWWCARINIDAKQKWIGFPFEISQDLLATGFEILPQTNVAATRISFNELSDLLQLEPVILSVMQKVIDEKNALRLTETTV